MDGPIARGDCEPRHRVGNSSQSARRFPVAPRTQLPQAKGIEEEDDGSRNPNRNAQFENIARLKKEYLNAGLPVVSMDTKKKELLGTFYREGKIDTRKRSANDHDFASAAWAR